jgi:carbon-monoxide dehydrogenase medium subunit/6-hydroxypseudooxynicotine dehydrogenase subunit alpha
LLASAEEAKVLAGGQSLVPLMNFRLARPELLVDINDLAELAHLHRIDGQLHIGALTRHAVLEESPLVQRHWPLLTEAVRFVGHTQIRNAGTVGGSVAHADPNAELPVALTAQDARFAISSQTTDRQVPCSEFFVDQLQTSLAPDELLVEIVVPPLPPKTGWRFAEFSRRHGDFAIAGCGVTISLDDDRACTQASIALLGVASTPLRATAAEKTLVGNTITERTAAQAAAEAVQGIHPRSDLHGSGDYRRRVTESLLTESILIAHQRALEVTLP